MTRKSHARQQRDKLRKGQELERQIPIFVTPHAGFKMPLRYEPGELTMEERRWLIKAKGLDVIDVLNLHVPSQQKELALVAEQMGIPRSYVQLTQAERLCLLQMPDYLRKLSYEKPAEPSAREQELTALLDQSLAEAQVAQDAKERENALRDAALEAGVPTPLSDEELAAMLPQAPSQPTPVDAESLPS